MSDLAQILLLPPPTPPIQRLPAREQELAVNAEQQQGGDAARGKRFRFRVYEGGEANTDIATRRTDPRTSLNGDGSTEDATARSSSGRIRYATAGNSASGSSSAFLAQAFAQEQLGQGLHNPPFAAASAAYTRTGAATFASRSGSSVNLSV
ncbi:hypothetical protein [Dongia sp. agr-C8]